MGLVERHQRHRAVARLDEQRARPQQVPVALGFVWRAVGLVEQQHRQLGRVPRPLVELDQSLDEAGLPGVGGQRRLQRGGRLGRAADPLGQLGQPLGGFDLRRALQQGRAAGSRSPARPPGLPPPRPARRPARMARGSGVLAPPEQLVARTGGLRPGPPGPAAARPGSGWRPAEPRRPRLPPPRLRQATRASVSGLKASSGEARWASCRAATAARRSPVRRVHLGAQEQEREPLLGLDVRTVEHRLDLGHRAGRVARGHQRPRELGEAPPGPRGPAGAPAAAGPGRPARRPDAGARRVAASQSNAAASPASRCREASLVSRSASGRPGIVGPVPLLELAAERSRRWASRAQPLSSTRRTRRLVAQPAPDLRQQSGAAAALALAVAGQQLLEQGRLLGGHLRRRACGPAAAAAAPGRRGPPAARARTGRPPGRRPPARAPRPAARPPAPRPPDRASRPAARSTARAAR